MRQKLSPFAYICECGRKWVFSAVDANTNRRCDCSRTIVIKRQAVYTESGGGAEKTAEASLAAPTRAAGGF